MLLLHLAMSLLHLANHLLKIKLDYLAYSEFMPCFNASPLNIAWDPFEFEFIYATPSRID
jgi:hypothetical protein